MFHSERTAALGRTDALLASALLDPGESGLQEFQDLVEALGHGPLDHVDVHDLVLPGVVIGDRGETAVAHTELACELALGYDGHSDDVRELPEHVALGPGGEPGALDAHVPSTHVVGDSHLLGDTLEDTVEVVAERFWKCDMDDPVIEVGVVTSLGEIHELIDDHQVTDGILLLKGSDGACGYDVLASQLLKCPHVGLVGDLVGRIGGGGSMTVKESDLDTCDPTYEDLVGGFPIRCVGEDLLDEFECIGVVDSRSADDCDLGHEQLNGIVL